MAETKGDAGKAADCFVEAYGRKYDKAVERLIKNRDRLPGSTISQPNTASASAQRTPSRARSPRCARETVKTKDCLSRKTAVAMACKPILSAKRKRRQPDGSDRLAGIIEGVLFKDGIKIAKHAV